MAFSKITDQDRLGKGNVGQPDTPLLTTTEMQEQMDSLSNLAIDRFNAFIDEISESTASNNIGCTAPSGITALPNLTAVLAAIVADYQAAKNNAHSHLNMTQLNGINASFMTAVNRVLYLLTATETVDPVIDEDSAATGVPTTLAVKNYVDGYNWKQVIRDAVYPIGAVYQTTSLPPDAVFGTVDKWTLVATDANGISSYKRIG